MKNILFTTIALAIISLFSYMTIAETPVPVTYGETPGKIEFIGDAGSPNVFVFQDWNITHAAMPEGKVENVEVEVEINIASMTTSWKELEQSVRKKKDYFYTKKFPKATISIKGAEAISDTEYKTMAMLRLKGIEKPVELTFTMEGNHVVGTGTIIRQEFNFKDKGPKNEVPVSFDINLPL